MVACLERIEGNDDFHQIVDFLNASTIRYSLTISPTIYASYIEQFWATAKSKIVNNETQIHAKIDGKTIVILESSVRSNLHFNDEDAFFSLMETQTPRQAKRGRDTEIPQSGGPPEKVGDEAVHKELGDRVERAATTAASLDADQDSGNILKTQSMAILNVPLSQGIGTSGSPKCQEAMGKVEGLESDLMKTKKLYATAFKELFNRVKSLEDEDDFVVEDPSKQGRSLIEEMDLDAGISLVPPHVETLMEIRKSAAKDKSKAKMDETESLRKMKQRERVQISRDEEVAQKLQEEFDAAERQRMAQVHPAAQGFTDAE
ncbi:hypothetical protein Tco_0120681 [Tanacetum coccineum]